MSQSDLNIANVTRTVFRQEVNEALQALGSLSSGATEPSTTYAYQLWADTGSGLLKQRNAANDGWINKGNLADVDWGFLNKAGGSMSGLLQLDQSTNIVAAATTNLGNATGNAVTVTHASGTVAITSFGGTSLQSGTELTITWSVSGGSLSVTHNATSLILPSAANLTIAGGDVWKVQKISDSQAYWRVIDVTKADGTPVVGGGASILGDSKNLIITNNAGTPDSQVDIDADEIILKDSSGRPYLAEAINLTVDITASGANGLDTGTEANSTWYYPYVIYNPTTDTVAGLLSASDASPTLPAGYTYFARAKGAIYNKSDGNFLRIIARDGYVRITELRYILTGALTVGAWTSFSVGAFFPPVAKTIETIHTVGSVTNYSVGLALDSSGMGANFDLGQARTNSYDFNGYLTTARFNATPLTNIYQATMYYFSNVASGDIIASGWEE